MAKARPGSQQQIDQVQCFGEDGQVLPGLFFLGKAEIIVRKWH